MIQIPAFYFDSKHLEQRLKQHDYIEQFRTADPFPHVVIDDFLPEEVIRRLMDEFPGEDDIEWTRWGPGRTDALAQPKLNKLGQSDERCFPPFIRHFMGQLLSGTFVRFVEAISGTKGLMVDPTHNGCGLHSTGRGGRLMIHTDVNRHPHGKKHLHQILNLIVYLNEGWKDEYNGHLELWTRERTPCKKILPIANRAVLFETGTRSFHGHPEPLQCPLGRRRNSLAVYYYCFDRPPSEKYDGMQKAVHWVPTSDEDLRVAADRSAGAETRVKQLSGATIVVPAGFLPVQVGQLRDRDPVHLSLAHESGLEPAVCDALRQARVAAMLPDGTQEGARFFILGYLSLAKAATITDEGSLLMLCDRGDGAVYIEHPETRRGLFCGYADRLLLALSTERRH